jgi:hypothetical protein
VIVRKGVRATREGRAKKKLIEIAKDATASVVRKAMTSKVGCATCQGARRKVGAKVLKAIGR